MGQFANITFKRMKNFLKWLGNHKTVDVLVAGNHPIKVTCHESKQSYPLPGHREVNKHIVKDFMEWLIKNGILTEEEFKEHL